VADTESFEFSSSAGVDSGDDVVVDSIPFKFSSTAGVDDVVGDTDPFKFSSTVGVDSGDDVVVDTESLEFSSAIVGELDGAVVLGSGDKVVEIESNPWPSTFAVPGNVVVVINPLEKTGAFVVVSVTAATGASTCEVADSNDA
jgi:hypothetical protein